MAIKNIDGFETGTSDEASSTSGSNSTSSAQKRTGGYSLLINPTTTGTGYRRWGPIESDGTNGDGSPGIGNNLAIRFYLYIDTLPSADEEICGSTAASGTTIKCSVRLTSTGNLKLYDSVPNLIGTSSTALSTGTWYLIEVRCPTGTSVTMRLRINEVEEVAATGNSNSTGHGRIWLGKSQDLNGSGYTCYFDDLRIDDSTSWIGPGQIEVMLPDANGSTMDWSAGTGGSDYTQVNEIPRSTSNYVQSTGGAGEVALFDLETATSAGISGTINCVKGTCRIRENTSVTSATKIRIRSNVTNSDSSTLDHSTSDSQSSRLLETDPDTAAAWTTGGLDALEVGVVEDNAVAVRCTWAGVMVDFVPAAPGGDAVPQCWSQYRRRRF